MMSGLEAELILRLVQGRGRPREWLAAVFRRHGLSSRTRNRSGCRMLAVRPQGGSTSATTKKPRVRPRCSPEMRPGGWRWTSPGCRTCLGRGIAIQRVGQAAATCRRAPAARRRWLRADVGAVIADFKSRDGPHW